MSNFPIVDLHCDTICELYRHHTNLREHQGYINLEKLQKGHVMMQCFAIFQPTERLAARWGVEPEPYAYYHKALEVFQREMHDLKGTVEQVTSMAELQSVADRNVIGAMLTIEDGKAIDGKIERVKEFYDDGVRMIALTWNGENSIGFPNSEDPELHGLGLKPFGLEVVAEMNRLGMVVDTSHLSEGGFWDVVKHSTKPFMASHSCARALCNHPRNLTDEQLKALGDKGGVCGVNFHTPFLEENAPGTSIEMVVRHAKYIADHAGIEAVAMGSDFDGISDELEFVDCAGFPLLMDALAKEFTSSELEKISHENAMRVFRDVIGK